MPSLGGLPATEFLLNWSNRSVDSEQTGVLNILRHDDPEIFAAVEAEATRQREGLEMIASENFTSAAVMQAVGSVLTNKYAEGYPGRRYYGGCEHVDVVENIARDRAKQLFGTSMQTFSRTPGVRPTRLSTSRQSSLVTRCWHLTLPMADISPTG